PGVIGHGDIRWVTDSQHQVEQAVRSRHVAIVVFAVTRDFFGPGMDGGIPVIAVRSAAHQGVKAIAVGILVAGVAFAVFIQVFLVCVGHETTIIIRTKDAVAILVPVTLIAQTVMIGVLLIGIREERA